MPRRRGPLHGAILLAIIAALLVAAPTAAASPWSSFSQSGTSAFASSSDCSENLDGTVTCEDQSLFVFEGTMKASGERPQKGEQVCYSEFTSTSDPNTGEPIDSDGVVGCTFDAGTLTINDLSSIVLAPTVMDLMAFQCDGFDCTETPAGSTTVSGTWTGVGPVISQKGRFTFDDGACVQVNAEKGSFREASFEGSFDAQFAQMRQGRFTFRTTCTF